ncbi:hypothetical protein NX79_21310 [Xanthomonas vasicola]|nr:hypothetical protein NX79_21310 [Xanthomonas vasicola]
MGALDFGGLVRSQPPRAVPVHPELIWLDFLDHAKRLVKANESQLSPKRRIDAINGRGSLITKAFGNFLKKMGGRWSPARHGLHSLRKLVIQELQGEGVASEMLAQIACYELDNKHHAVYSRDFTPWAKLHGVKSPAVLVIVP